ANDGPDGGDLPRRDPLVPGSDLVCRWRWHRQTTMTGMHDARKSCRSRRQWHRSQLDACSRQRSTQHCRMTSIMLIAGVATLLRAAPCQQTAAPTALDASALLRRAAERTGLPRSGGVVLKTVAFDVRSHT